MSVSLTNGCTHRSKHLLVLELLTLYFDLIKGSVYFKVLALIEAASKKKRRKAERKTLSNFDDTERD